LSLSTLSQPPHFVLEYPVFTESLAAGQQTLLQFLQPRYAKMDEESLSRWISSDQIRLDGDQATADTLLEPGQRVTILLLDHPEDPVDTGWQLIWENSEIMAVYKPHLLPVSRTTRNLYNTLIQLVRRQTPYYDAHLLHRLDTETSGLILIAKDKAADKKWKKQLEQLIEQKIYHARVYGRPQWQQCTLECELSEQLGSAIRSQMYVVDPSRPYAFSKPKQSKTAFRVLEYSGDNSLIECELFSGRKHQIRAHLAHLGHPIIGDKIYAHHGHYYLKRLEAPLTSDEISKLGGAHHQLQAVRLQIRPYPDQAAITIELPPQLRLQP